MTNTLAIISIVEGLLLPVLVSFLKGQQWSQNVKLVFSLAISIVIAIITLAIQSNGFNWRELLANAATIWAAAQVVYNTWFKDTATQASLAAMLPWSKAGA